MFYSHEDVTPAVTAAVQVFGPQAQYQSHPFTYLAISTPKYGKIWYGDVSMDLASIKLACSELAKKIQEPITALDLGTNHQIFATNP